MLMDCLVMDAALQVKRFCPISLLMLWPMLAEGTFAGITPSESMFHFGPARQLILAEIQMSRLADVIILVNY